MTDTHEHTCMKHTHIQTYTHARRSNSSAGLGQSGISCTISFYNITDYCVWEEGRRKEKKTGGGREERDFDWSHDLISESN